MKINKDIKHCHKQLDLNICACTVYASLKCGWGHTLLSQTTVEFWAEIRTGGSRKTIYTLNLQDIHQKTLLGCSQREFRNRRIWEKILKINDVDSKNKRTTYSMVRWGHHEDFQWVRILLTIKPPVCRNSNFYMVSRPVVALLPFKSWNSLDYSFQLLHCSINCLSAIILRLVLRLSLTQ